VTTAALFALVAASNRSCATRNSLFVAAVAAVDVAS